jgi:chemotaxis protein MotB
MGKSEGGAETWLMTYGDMVTLLMVFFIVLYTMTPGVEDRAFNSFISYFQKSTGFFDDMAINAETMENKDVQMEEVETMVEEAIEQWMAFADFLKEHELDSDVSVELLSDGVLITLSDSLTFESGSSVLLPEAKEILGEVSKVLNARIQVIEVQGHTDNVPISGNSQFNTNWHLGAARAVSVVQELQEVAQVPPDRFVATSYGEYKPLADNATPEGRRKNRRVEIYLRDAPKYEDETMLEFGVAGF